MANSQHFDGERPIKIFFDTEFTGLSSDPHLLSIGLVAEDGETLYIEFTNGWTEADCSFWVREHVMPMLGQGERLTRRDAVTRILAWLESQKQPITLLGETAWDTDLFAGLMHECGIDPDRFALESVAFSDKSQATAFAAARQRYFDQNRMPQHHALTDAQAFRWAWSSVFAPL